MVRDISALVAQAAQDVPERRALVESGGRSITWTDLEYEVGRLATGLSGVGIRAGQRVMLVIGNKIEFVTSYVGILRAQVVAVPVNPAAGAASLAAMIADSGSRLVIVDEPSLPAVREAIVMLVSAIEGAATDLPPALVASAVRPIVVVIGADPAPGEITFADLHAAERRPVPPLQDPEKLAALLYTSGADGTPRAAMLTHRALLANLEQVAEIGPEMMHGDDVVLGALPLFHVYGLNAVLGAVLLHRAKLVLVEQWDPQAVLDLIEDEACSVLPLAPPVFAHWLGDEHLRERLGPVRLVLSGSAPLGAESIEQFRAATGLAVHQGYGLTEAAPVVTSTMASSAPRPGSVGVALPGVEIRLLDELGAAAAGEDPAQIQIRGANLFSGYWPEGADGPDADGWWTTGDVGFIDAGGDLVLVDRVEEVITVNGFRVYPSEVEQVLAKVEGVVAVAALGVDDEVSGQCVVAYVQAPDVDPAELQARVMAAAEADLARFKRPIRIEVVDDIPRSDTGRVRKRKLRGVERRRALGLLE